MSGRLIKSNSDTSLSVTLGVYIRLISLLRDGPFSQDGEKKHYDNRTDYSPDGGRRMPRERGRYGRVITCARYSIRPTGKFMLLSCSFVRLFILPD